MITKILKNAIKDIELSWEGIFNLNSFLDRVETNPKLLNIVNEEDIVVITTFDVAINRKSMTLSLCMPYLMLDLVRNKIDTKIISGNNDINYSNVRGNKDFFEKIFKHENW